MPIHAGEKQLLAAGQAVKTAVVENVICGR